MTDDQFSENRTNLILVQPTPFCNIDCSYCYLQDRSKSVRMSPDTAEQMFARLFALPTVRGRTTVVWHAGEPLAMPITAFEELLEAALRAKPNELIVNFNVQTNATLISPAWCELLKKYQVVVGVSVDGPKHINDRSRLSRSGASTYDQTVRGMNLLREADIPFHVITVLTTHSLDHADEMFEFYKDHGIDQIGFNVEEREGPHKVSSMGSSNELVRYRNFLHKFIMIAKASKSAVEIRELEATLRSIEGWRADRVVLNEQVNPFAIISMDVEGNLSTFSPELLGATHERFPSFKIGNILTDSFDDLCSSPTFQALWSEIRRGVEECKSSCRYFGICGGGAPSNKLFENGTFASTETYYCKYSKKVPADIILQLASNALATGNPITQTPQ
jgi:uncharacterized protein